MSFWRVNCVGIMKKRVAGVVVILESEEEMRNAVDLTTYHTIV